MIELTGSLVGILFGCFMVLAISLPMLLVMLVSQDISHRRKEDRLYNRIDELLERMCK